MEGDQQAEQRGRCHQEDEAQVLYVGGVHALREVKSLRKLNHPNVVKLKEVRAVSVPFSHPRRFADASTCLR